MSKFKYYAGAALGLLLLAGVLSVIGPKRALAALGYTPVRDVDNPAQQPFQKIFQVESAASTNFAEQTFKVPAGKRLVIEYISASINEYPAGGTTRVYLITTAGGEQVYYQLTGPVSNYDKHNQLVRIYADPQTTVGVLATSDGGNFAGTDTEISGYYVNVP